MRPRIYLATLALILVGCVDSESGDVVAPTADDPSTTHSSTTDAGEVPTTPPPLSTTSPDGTDQTFVEPEADVFRIAPAGPGPELAIRYGPDGVFHAGHTDRFTKVVDGPVSVAVDTYETGIVYQRPGDNRRVFIQGVDGDQELLVAAENQTIELVGIRIEPTDEIFHILYTRRTSSTPETTEETLRSYSMDTGEVTEIYQTGGWESGTDFNYIEGELAVGRWSGEGFGRIDIVNVVTGQIKQSFPEVGECFDGDQAKGCLPFIVANISGETIYGFGPRPNDAGLVDTMALYKLDTTSSELTELIFFPWDNGLYYPIDIWVTAVSRQVVVSLSTAPRADDGQPLPALIYDIETGEARTAPVSGYFHTGFIS